MKRKGYDLFAESVVATGSEAFFYLIGGPLTRGMEACARLGMRGVDVRDERAGTFAAIGYSRVSRRPGIVMTGSGPGTTNVVTGLSHAFVDGSPVISLGGSATMYQRGIGQFQELDQVSLMRPITKWTYQVAAAEMIPQSVRDAFSTACGGAPGPVYLDLPADVLFQDVDVEPPSPSRMWLDDVPRHQGDPGAIAQAVELVRTSERPIFLVGSGVYWSNAWEELREIVDKSRIPFFTTPIARGLIPEDHPLCLAASRSTAFREADLLFVIGTRANYVVNHLRPPVMNPKGRLIELNTHPGDISRNRVADVAILADAKLGLRQLNAEMERHVVPDRFSGWVERLRAVDASGRARVQASIKPEAVPIQPLHLCAQIAQALPRDAILVVDGHEILGFSKLGIRSSLPGHTLTPGAFGTMGVGLPFAIGAKVAAPDAPVLLLTGDGAFGYHAMELDTAVRHKLGLVVVISNNGGWTAKRGQPGWDLGFTDYHRLGDVFGVLNERVTEPRAVGPAIARALDFAARERKPAIVNVIVAPDEWEGRSFVQFRPDGAVASSPV